MTDLELLNPKPLELNQYMRVEMKAWLRKLAICACALSLSLALLFAGGAR